jgi:hypothetical protein
MTVKDMLKNLKIKYQIRALDRDQWIDAELVFRSRNGRSLGRACDLREILGI